MSDPTPYTTTPAQPHQQSPSEQSGVLAILGFALAFMFNIAGLIVSIIALMQIKRTGGPGRGLALAGVIISAATIVLSVVFLVVIISAAGTSSTTGS